MRPTRMLDALARGCGPGPAMPASELRFELLRPLARHINDFVGLPEQDLTPEGWGEIARRLHYTAELCAQHTHPLAPSPWAEG